MKKLVFILTTFFLAFSPLFASTPAIPELLVEPSTVIQGEPVLISFVGLNSIQDIEPVKFLGKPVKFFYDDGKIKTLLGVDIREKVGTYKLYIKLKNGVTYEKNITISNRIKIEEPLPIPENLGGNTNESQNNLVNDLNKENALLENLRSAKPALWWENFLSPLSNVLITSPFGYSRDTGKYSIAHKGVDFRAATGTRVFSINNGIVRVAGEGRTYGKMVGVDHGAGIQSFYLHLSEIKVKVGQIVSRGEVLGLSGQTGYVSGPHLHLSIRINGTSIDPVKFFELFGLPI